MTHPDAFGLVRFAMDTVLGPVERLGAVMPGDDERVLDLRLALAAQLARTGDTQAGQIACVRIPDRLEQLIAAGASAMDAVRAAVAHGRGLDRAAPPWLGRDTLRLMVPLTPGKIIGMGRNYLEHQRESAMPPPDDYPRGFVKVASTLTAPGADVPHPATTSQLDYEVELSIVIGAPGIDIPEDGAMAHVFGYTILNDVSARDWQLDERTKGNHVLGKNFPGLGPLGPCVVPREFLPDAGDLAIALRVNGQTRQSARTSDMMYSIPQMIAHWSRMGLEPGDLIATGTPGGVALGRKPPDPTAFLKPGDVVEAEIEGIGILRNRIV